MQMISSTYCFHQGVGISDQNVYQDCRDLNKTIHKKVIKQLSDLKIVLVRSLKVYTTILTLQGTIVLQPGFMDFHNPWTGGTTQTHNFCLWYLQLQSLKIPNKDFAEIDR